MAKTMGSLKEGYEYHMPRDDEAWIQEQGARAAEAAHRCCNSCAYYDGHECRISGEYIEYPQEDAVCANFSA